MQISYLILSYSCADAKCLQFLSFIGTILTVKGSVPSISVASVPSFIKDQPCDAYIKVVLPHIYTAETQFLLAGNKLFCLYEVRRSGCKTCNCCDTSTIRGENYDRFSDPVNFVAKNVTSKLNTEYRPSFASFRPLKISLVLISALLLHPRVLASFLYFLFALPFHWRGQLNGGTQAGKAINLKK